MRTIYFLAVCLLLTCLSGRAQQIMYPNLKSLLANRGDTATTLCVEKRSRNQIYLTGGADYRIYTDGNAGLNRYLRSRCYAVRIDTTLYLNCRKMRYMRYRFGNWYAPTLIVNRHLFFCAQPLGQIASSSFSSDDTPKLGGDVGNAIQVSGYVADRVYYELDTETGRAEFVGKEYLKKRLAHRPDVVEAIEAEPTEAASALRKYLLMLP